MQFRNRLPRGAAFSAADAIAVEAFAQELEPSLSASARVRAYAVVSRRASVHRHSGLSAVLKRTPCSAPRHSPQHLRNAAASGVPAAQVGLHASVLHQFWHGEAESGSGDIHSSDPAESTRTDAAARIRRFLHGRRLVLLASRLPSAQAKQPLSPPGEHPDAQTLTPVSFKSVPSPLETTPSAVPWLDRSPHQTEGPSSAAAAASLRAPPAALRVRDCTEAVTCVVNFASELGVTTVHECACFGVTADRASVSCFCDTTPSSESLRRVASAILAGYLAKPFHNWRHGFDVSHCAFLILDAVPGVAATLGPVGRLAVLIGSLAHDIAHPGNTNGFEVRRGKIGLALLTSVYATSVPHALQINSVSELAVTYNNQSVLENHHAATLFRLLLNAPLQAAAQIRRDAAFRVSTSSGEVTSHSSHLQPPPPAHNALGLPRAVFAQVHSCYVSRTTVVVAGQPTAHLSPCSSVASLCLVFWARIWRATLSS